MTVACRFACSGMLVEHELGRFAVTTPAARAL